MEFLAALIIGGFLWMGFGAILWMLAKTTMGGVKAMDQFVAVWKEQVGFTRAEMIEKALEEIRTGTVVKEEQVPSARTDFGVGAACITLLVFIPWYLFVTPVAVMMLSFKRRELLHKYRMMGGDRLQLASEYRRWLYGISK